MFTKTFWRLAIERAIRSMAQVLILVLATGYGAKDSNPQVNAFLIDWKTCLGFAIGSAILSIATSLAASGIGPANDPSFITGNPQV